MDLPTHNPPPMRVLNRPPPPPPPQPQQQQPPSIHILTSSSSSSTSSSFDPQTQLQSRSSLDGVVVVGFVSHSPDDCSSQLVNRLLDSNAFGSGNLDKTLLSLDDNEQLADWFKWRKISYFHEEDKGILFLRFCSTWSLLNHGVQGSSSGFDTAFEQREFEDLQGLLFMFSVCHVIIYIQEGSRFDTRMLKKFRVLQAAKHALAPYMKSLTAPPVQARPHSSSSSSRRSFSTSTSPAKSGGIMSRNNSALSLMSGLGSYASLFPGNCTPVILFVFIDDFLDAPNSSSNMEELADGSLLNQSSSLSSLARPNLPAKGSGSVVVLARPVSKSDGGVKKKLQSSLEAQIRYLIKKCRTLSGSESGQAGSRSSSVPSSAPLFSLDGSRTVVLLDRLTNKKGESLEFAMNLVEDVLNAKATSDSLLLESLNQSANKDDISSIKEFIYRQSDILRGRGGLVTNANSGSAAGLGKIAVAAAAAAAASAASGKTFPSPELPSMETWLSSCQFILQGVIAAKGFSLDENEIDKRKSRQLNIDAAHVEGVARGMDALESAVSVLESGKGLNTKFSTSWCEKALPTAKDVYLKDLPACYPTSLHEAHLEKALRAFHSMVRGPAVQLFARRLQDECTFIWKSGRQLCDAVSLTGKPCMHQRHDVGNGTVLGSAKTHSSGYFFLHACACGRSRQLRSDPFDFESANVTSSCFQDCDKILPAVHLPEFSDTGPVQSSSWRLIRVGGARYYDPSKGLLQSGFSNMHKYLLRWTIYLDKPSDPIAIHARTVPKESVSRRANTVQSDVNADMDRKKTSAVRLYAGDLPGVENQGKPSESSKIDAKKLSFGKGLPNFTMRKPFSEVVAGSTADSGFPPLQRKKQPVSGSETCVKQIKVRDRSAETVDADFEQGSQNRDHLSAVPKPLEGIACNDSLVGDPVLHVGSNVVPMNINVVEKVKKNPSLKQATIFVGFEHECPHGHRFLLSPDHMRELGSPYSSPEESSIPSEKSVDHNLGGHSNLGRNGNHNKIRRSSRSMTVSGADSGLRNLDKSKELVVNSDLSFEGLVQLSSSGKGGNQMIINGPKCLHSVKDPEVDLHSVSLDDGGIAFSMLNRHLPLYMNCPYCKISKKKKDSPKIKFAGTISQLQRIFLVTPPFPVALATCPVVQFEASCLPPSVLDRERKLQFSLGCHVVLPPDSFLALRLPFVYGVQLEDKSLHALSAYERQPERTAWIVKGTLLQIVSIGRGASDGPQS